MNSAFYIAPLAVLFGLGCSSRSAPTTFPPESPASDSATEAKRAPVTTALDEDPPLPGEPSEGWSGLDAPAPTEAAPAATYVCPMHPEVVSDRAGRCPKCGMNLEPRP